MREWYKTTGGDVAIRAGGLAALAAAWLATSTLCRLTAMRPAHAPTPIELMFAAIGFLAASAGAAALAIGRHLFDEVAISRRWRRLPDRFRS